MDFIKRLIETNAPASVIIIRVMVGLVFLSEGIQKFLYPADLGVGRFTKIGIPAPEFFAPFVGTVEIIAGILITVGLVTRFAAIPLIIVMLVAIYSTKLGMLYDKGFWAMAHEGRADWSVLLGLLFILIVGAGALSVDARLLGGNGRNER